MPGAHHPCVAGGRLLAWVVFACDSATCMPCKAQAALLPRWDVRCDCSHAPRLLRELICRCRGCSVGSRCRSVSRVVTGQLVVGDAIEGPKWAT